MLTEPTAGTEAGRVEVTGDQQASQTGAATTDDANAELGDSGKKAIQAEREARKAAEKSAKEANDRAAALEAKEQGREAEHVAALEAQRAKDEALAGANKRIVSAELRAAATGKLADPLDALAFIDITDFEVSDDGSVKDAEITAAIADLIERKPHLAARGGSNTTGPQPDRSQGATAGTGGPSTSQQFAAAVSKK